MILTLYYSPGNTETIVVAEPVSRIQFWGDSLTTNYPINDIKFAEGYAYQLCEEYKAKYSPAVCEFVAHSGWESSHAKYNQEKALINYWEYPWESDVNVKFVNLGANDYFNGKEVNFNISWLTDYNTVIVGMNTYYINHVGLTLNPRWEYYTGNLSGTHVPLFPGLQTTNSYTCNYHYHLTDVGNMYVFNQLTRYLNSPPPPPPPYPPL